MQIFSRRFGICAVLMIAALIAYWPATHAEFVGWDDNTTVQENPALDSPGWKIFLERWTKPYLAMYMPVTQSVYQADGLVARTRLPSGQYELNPWVFHWTMVAIAVLNIPLIFTFLRRLVGDDLAAAAGTALMVLHPITDEAFAWVSEVSIPLCTMFLVVALLQWLNYRRGGKRLHFALAFALYILALLTKPICICFPVMAWALDVWFVGINWKRSAMLLLPWLLPALALGIYMNHLQPAAHYSVFVPPLWQRPAVAVDALVFYLGKILVPVNLAADYGRVPDWVLSQHRLLVYEFAAMLLLSIGIWRLRRRQPLILCAAIFFLAGMGAVLGLTPFWFQVFSTVADRYAYVSMLGVAMVIAVLLAGVRMLWPWVLVVVAMLICMNLTYHQAETWHDSLALYTQIMRVHPNSWMAWDNTAYMLVGDGQPVRGITLSRVAYSLDSTQTDIYSNIGTALAMLGDPKQAVPYFRRVIYAKPEDPITSMNLGAAYVQLHQYDLGIKWLQYAHKLNPSSKKVQWLLSGAIQMRDKLNHPTSRAVTQR